MLNRKSMKKICCNHNLFSKHQLSRTHQVFSTRYISTCIITSQSEASLSVIDQTFANLAGNDLSYNSFFIVLIGKKCYTLFFHVLSSFCFPHDGWHGRIFPTKRVSLLIARCSLSLNNRHWSAKEPAVGNINFYGFLDTLAVKDSQGSLLESYSLRCFPR